MSTELLDILMEDENRDILTELTDTRFLTRRHYNKNVYADGCRGPLCRKKERDLARAAREALATAEGRVYQPGRTPRNDERDELLDLVVEWHYEKLELAKLQRRANRDTARIKERLAHHRKQVADLETRLEGLSA